MSTSQQRNVRYMQARGFVEEDERRKKREMKACDSLLSAMKREASRKRVLPVPPSSEPEQASECLPAPPSSTEDHLHELEYSELLTRLIDVLY